MTKKFSKFPRSATCGYYVVFGKDDWAAMEAKEVYGQKLSKDVRDLVSLATLYLTLMRPEEQLSPRLKGATSKRLGKIAELAEKLRSELFSPHRWLPEYQADRVLRDTKSRLLLELQQIEDSDNNEFLLLRACLNSIIEISDIIIGKIGKDGFGHRDGQTWEVWIVLITLIMESRGLSIAIRSDPYRILANQEESPSSPFVRLIKYLEDRVLQGKRSLGAVAKAIQRARRSIDSSSVKPSEIEDTIYRILNVPKYAGLRQESSDMEYMVQWVLEGRKVGVHSIAPEPFYYSDDVSQPDCGNQQAVSEQPKRHRRTRR